MIPVEAQEQVVQYWVDSKSADAASFYIAGEGCGLVCGKGPLMFWATNTALEHWHIAMQGSTGTGVRQGEHASGTGMLTFWLMQAVV